MESTVQSELNEIKRTLESLSSETQRLGALMERLVVVEERNARLNEKIELYQTTNTEKFREVREQLKAMEKREKTAVDDHYSLDKRVVYLTTIIMAAGVTATTIIPAVIHILFGG